MELHELTRFWSKTAADENSCITWAAHRTHNGYGKFWLRGKMRTAHRVAYEAIRGPIQDGLVVDHLCRNRACCNPWHMELVSADENVRRGRRWQAEKTHCPKGHEYTESNTYRWHGERQCRACRSTRKG